MSLKKGKKREVRNGGIIKKKKGYVSMSVKSPSPIFFDHLLGWLTEESV